jgi:hypothetical protein
MTSNTIYPSVGLDHRIPEFLARFYRISDDENATAEYPNLFTQDASFKFTSLQLRGIEGSYIAKLC